MDNPLVSIIIPTYNRSYIICETLDSLLAQTYTNWECIVVDDGSRDYTKELMEFYCSKDKRITYHQRPTASRKGPNSCRNFGFDISKGRYINWIDSDDILFPNAIEKKLRNIEGNDVIISSVKYIDDNKRHIELVHHYFSPKNIIEDYFLGKITFYTFTPLWNRIFLDKQLELFDEKISNLDDWDFNLRMIYQKPRIKYLHEPLILYRLHDNSLSQEIEKLNIKELKSEFYARKKHLKILKNHTKINIEYLKEYDKNRCKNRLRKALAENHPEKFAIYIMLSRRQITLFNFSELLKTSIGFFVVSIFHKGDRFLK